MGNNMLNIKNIHRIEGGMVMGKEKWKIYKVEELRENYIFHLHNLKQETITVQLCRNPQLQKMSGMNLYELWMWDKKGNPKRLNLLKDNLGTPNRGLKAIKTLINR